MLMAAALTTLVALYMGLVADRAFQLLTTDDGAARWLGGALMIFPVIGIWWVIHEWSLGTAVQKMTNILEDHGRLPIHDGETLPSGRLTEEAAEAVFEVASRNVDENPEDWRAWFHVAHAYEANRDRRMARKTLRHAADLFKRERRALRA